MKKIKNFKSGTKLLIIGVGNELMGDDAAGFSVIREIESIQKEKGPGNIKTLYAGTAPENHTGRINAMNPSRIIIVDAGNFGAAPGAVARVSPADLGGINFSTHGMPLRMTAEYLKNSANAEIEIIVIQKKDTTAGAAITPEVLASAKKLALEIYNSHL